MKIKIYRDHYAEENKILIGIREINLISVTILIDHSKVRKQKLRFVSKKNHPIILIGIREINLIFLIIFF
jgi:hypothetical protein